MVGVYMSVWVRAGLLPHIRGVQATSVGTGIMGYLGNKGAPRPTKLNSLLCCWVLLCIQLCICSTQTPLSQQALPLSTAVLRLTMAVSQHSIECGHIERLTKPLSSCRRGGRKAAALRYRAGAGGGAFVVRRGRRRRAAAQLRLLRDYPPRRFPAGFGRACSGP